MEYQQHAKECVSWPKHVSNERLKAFIVGDVELDSDEQTHVVICTQCSHRIADWVLAGDRRPTIRTH